MSSLEALGDRAALIDLVHRYAAAIDARDLDALVDCFAEDSVAEYAGGIRLEGRSAISAFMQDAFRNGIGMETSSTHLMTNTLVDLDGHLADVRTTAIACLTNRPGKVTVRGLRYIDRCTRQDGVWRFASRRHEADWEFDADNIALSKLTQFPDNKEERHGSN